MYLFHTITDSKVKLIWFPLTRQIPVHLVWVALLMCVCSMYLYPDDYPVWFQGYTVFLRGNLATMTPLWSKLYHTHTALWGSVLTSCKQMQLLSNIIRDYAWRLQLYLLPGNICLLTGLMALLQFHCKSDLTVTHWPLSKVWSSFKYLDYLSQNVGTYLFTVLFITCISSAYQIIRIPHVLSHLIWETLQFKFWATAKDFKMCLNKNFTA